MQTQAQMQTQRRSSRGLTQQASSRTSSSMMSPMRRLHVSPLLLAALALLSLLLAASISPSHATERIPIRVPSPIHSTPSAPRDAAPAPSPIAAPMLEVAPTPEERSAGLYAPEDFPSGPRPRPNQQEEPLPLSPPGTYLHSAVLIQGRMYVYGGLASYEPERYMNDLWMYDAGAGEYTQLQGSYVPPLPRTAGLTATDAASFAPADVPAMPGLARAPGEKKSEVQALRPNAAPSNPFLPRARAARPVRVLALPHLYAKDAHKPNAAGLRADQLYNHPKAAFEQADEHVRKERPQEQANQGQQQAEQTQQQQQGSGRGMRRRQRQQASATQQSRASQFGSSFTRSASSAEGPMSAQAAAVLLGSQLPQRRFRRVVDAAVDDNTLMAQPGQMEQQQQQPQQMVDPNAPMQQQQQQQPQQTMSGLTPEQEELLMAAGQPLPLSDEAAAMMAQQQQQQQAAMDGMPADQSFVPDAAMQQQAAGGMHELNVDPAAANYAPQQSGYDSPMGGVPQAQPMEAYASFLESESHLSLYQRARHRFVARNLRAVDEARRGQQRSHRLLTRAQAGDNAGTAYASSRFRREGVAADYAFDGERSPQRPDVRRHRPDTASAGSAPADADPQRLHDFWVYDFATHEWSLTPVRSSHPLAHSPWLSARQLQDPLLKDPLPALLPPTRRLHTSVVMKDRMIVFGGVSHNNLILGDLWVFDPAESSWVEAAADGPGGSPILPREGHSAVTLADELTMLVFGGVSYGFLPFNDLWQYSAVDNEWTRLASPSPSSDASAPMPRWLHTAVHYAPPVDSSAADSAPASESMVVFGGVTAHYVPLNDVAVWDVVGRSWSKPAVKGTPPFPRMMHTAVVVRDTMLVSGGAANNLPLDDMWALDLRSWTWRELLQTGAYPFARTGASAVVLSPAKRAIETNELPDLDDDASDPHLNWRADAAAVASRPVVASFSSEGLEAAADERRGSVAALDAIADPKHAVYAAGERPAQPRPMFRYRKHSRNNAYVVTFGGAAATADAQQQQQQQQQQAAAAH